MDGRFPFGLMNQEFAQFVGFISYLPGTLVPGRIVLQQVRVLCPNHCGTGATGRDDDFVRLQGFNGAFSQISGFGSETAIEKGLTTASLGRRKIDFIADPT
jgi:hypothetical protein